MAEYISKYIGDDIDKLLTFVNENQSVLKVKEKPLAVTYGGTGVTTDAALSLKSYPVGSVYISYESTSPASLFGGTWTSITGRFPYFNSGTTTGGSNTHTLTVAQMPKHSHRVSLLENGSTQDGGLDWSYNTGNAGYGGNIAYSGYIEMTGGGDSHNNMPAYQTLYAWRRTA